MTKIRWRPKWTDGSIPERRIAARVCRGKLRALERVREVYRDDTRMIRALESIEAYLKAQVSTKWWIEHYSDGLADWFKDAGVNESSV